MPHDKPEEKEWLHLRDAICLGQVDVIVDQLYKEGVHVNYLEMEEQLISLKTHVGGDACAIVDKDTFKESINYLISESITIPQPQNAPEIRTYRESMDSRRWDRIFDDMVKAAADVPAAGPGAHEPGHQQTWQEALMDARRWAVTKNQYALVYIDALLGGEVGERAEGYSQAGIYGSDRESAIRTQLLYVINNLSGWRGEEARAAKATLRAVSKGDLPAHYTAETPQGALEGMEERLIQDSQFRQRMTQQTLNAALAQMELRVGEIADAIRQMGERGIPVQVAEQIQEAAETIEDAAEQISGRRTPTTIAIRNYIRSLGKAGAAQTTRRQVAADVMEAHPEFGQITEVAVGNALRTLRTEGFTLLSQRGLGTTPQVPAPRELGPRAGTKRRVIYDALINLGDDAFITTLADFLDNLNTDNPGRAFADVDYNSVIRAFPDIPRVVSPGRGRSEAAEEPRQVIQAMPPAEGGSLADLLGGYERPERMRNGPWY